MANRSPGTRRSFLKLGALLVPAVAAPTVAYSFLWGRREIECGMVLPHSSSILPDELDQLRARGWTINISDNPMTPLSAIKCGPPTEAEIAALDAWALKRYGLMC